MDGTRKASLAKTFASAREAAMQRDTATFLGVTPPPEVAQFIALLGTKIEKPAFRKIVEFVFEHLKGTNITEQHWEGLKQGTGLPAPVLGTAFAGMLTLLKRAIRTRVPVESFSHDAVEVLKIPPEFAKDLGALIRNWHSGPRDIALQNKTPTMPGLAQFKWRVDVTIMTSSLNRVLKPSVLMNITTTTGQIYTFEVSPAMFHKLRYSVARLLKEVDNVDNLPILSVDRVKQ